MLLLDAIVPEHDLLGDVARERERDFAAGPADRRRLELGDPLLEIRAAVTPPFACLR